MNLFFIMETNHALHCLNPVSVMLAAVTFKNANSVAPFQFLASLKFD